MAPLLHRATITSTCVPRQTAAIISTPSHREVATFIVTIPLTNVDHSTAQARNAVCTNRTQSAMDLLL